MTEQCWFIFFVLSGNKPRL